jgi:O-antigen/teichoic acid export membrane protein
MNGPPARDSVIRRLASRVPRGRLARNTIAVALWSATRVGVQALWLVVAARLLGPAGYGTFAGLSGLATTLSGFVGAGLALVMYQDVANHPGRFGLRWRQTIVTSLATGAVFAAALLAFGGRLAGGLDAHVVLAIAIAELFGFPLTSAAAFAFGSHERMGWSVALPALLGVARLIALGLFQLFGDGTLASYAWFHACASLVWAAFAIGLVQVLLKPPATPFAIGRADLREGLGFTVLWVTSIALGSFDKALALRFAGAEVAGLYTSAYRLATVLALPMDALLTASMPRLFREGGGTSTPRLTPILFALTLAYGALAGVVLWFAADLLPLLLGAKFAAAAHAARGLAFFLPCYGLRYLGTNLLMARRCKTERVVIEICGIAALTALGAWWLPRDGLDGAIRMVITAEALLALASWSALAWAGRRRLATAPSP